MCSEAVVSLIDGCMTLTIEPATVRSDARARQSNNRLMTLMVVQRVTQGVSDVSSWSRPTAEARDKSHIAYELMQRLAFIM